MAEARLVDSQIEAGNQSMQCYTDPSHEDESRAAAELAVKWQWFMVMLRDLCNTDDEQWTIETQIVSEIEQPNQT